MKTPVWWCNHCRRAIETDEKIDKRLFVLHCHYGIEPEFYWEDKPEEGEGMSEQPDWRGKTCGDCAWAHFYGKEYGDETPYYFACRHLAWQGDNYERINIPACPAFVPRTPEGEAE